MRSSYTKSLLEQLENLSLEHNLPLGIFEKVFHFIELININDPLEDLGLIVTKLKNL